MGEKAGVTIVHTTADELLIEDGVLTGVRAGHKAYKADRIIVATGGASYPQTGSTGDGYRFARQAGHTVVPANPSLVPLVEDGDTCQKLMGLSLRNVQLTVYENEKKLYSDFGEMLFTHFGLSGPLVLSASAHMRHFGSKKYRVEIDLKPALDEKTLDKRLLADFDKHKNSDFINALGELLPKKLIPVVIEKSGIDRARRSIPSPRHSVPRCCAYSRRSRSRFPASVRSPRRLSPRAACPSARSARKPWSPKSCRTCISQVRCSMWTPTRAASTCRLRGPRAVWRVCRLRRRNHDEVYFGCH